MIKGGSEFIACCVFRVVLFVGMVVKLFVSSDKETMVGKWLSMAVFNDFMNYLGLAIFLVWTIRLRYETVQYTRLNSSAGEEGGDPENPSTHRIKVTKCKNAAVRMIQNNSKTLVMLSIFGTLGLAMAGVGICLYEQRKVGIELTFALLELFSIVALMLIYYGY